jgi:Ser/Thr protein kinase RdoA (MazF antagonist)
VKAVAALDAAVYAIDWADGRRWIARLFPRGRSLASVEGDAEILRFLAEEQFPAERCAAANAVTSLDGRAVLITSRVSGTSGRQARGVRFFEGLGELLGRLQTR